MVQIIFLPCNFERGDLPTHDTMKKHNITSSYNHLIETWNNFNDVAFVSPTRVVTLYVVVTHFLD